MRRRSPRRWWHGPSRWGWALIAAGVVLGFVGTKTMMGAW